MARTMVAYRRDGKWQSIDRTLKSLLIGYDMMPLIGLPAMKERLQSKGEFVRVTIEPVSRGGDSFCLFRKNAPVLGFLEWGGLPSKRESAARSACGFLRDTFKDDEETWKTLERCWFSLNEYKPGSAAAALKKLGYTVRRIALVPVAK